MTTQLPYLALDSAGNRTILNDYSLPISGGKTTIRKEKTMSRILTNQEVQAHTKKLVARLLGQDSTMDDEAAEKLKGFLKSRLSAEDHEQVCNMLAGEVAAQDDTEQGGTPLPLVRDTLPTTRLGGAAADAKSFNERYPGLAHIRNDTSGIQPKPRGRASSVAMDATSSKSFSERFPGLAHIRQA